MDELPAAAIDRAAWRQRYRVRRPYGQVTGISMPWENCRPVPSQKLPDVLCGAGQIRKYVGISDTTLILARTKLVHGCHILVHRVRDPSGLHRSQFLSMRRVPALYFSANKICQI